MNTFIYIMIFIMGTFFGSFFSLAVYRIPLKKDITHEHSFCPNCNHKLSVLDLIPVWSYIFLKGKCRYCGEKVRIRYLLLEVLSGIVFLLAFLSLKIEDFYFDGSKVIDFIFFIALYVTLTLVAGIDKEHRKINFPVIIFGAVCQAVYILYLYVIGNTSMYRYSIYFAIFVIAFLVIAIIQRKKELYFLQLIVLELYIFSIVGYAKCALNAFITMFLIIILNVLKKKKYSKISEVPIGFLICITTIVCEIIDNFIEFYIV